jgi:hypothetical protein
VKDIDRIARSVRATIWQVMGGEEGLEEARRLMSEGDAEPDAPPDDFDLSPESIVGARIIDEQERREAEAWYAEHDAEEQER